MKRKNKKKIEENVKIKSGMNGPVISEGMIKIKEIEKKLSTLLFII